MNAGSPTRYFRDSPGYDMLLQRAYDAQRKAAKKMDAQLGISAYQKPTSDHDPDQK